MASELDDELTNSPNPVLFKRQSSIADRVSVGGAEILNNTPDSDQIFDFNQTKHSTAVDCKIIIDQPDILFMKKEEKLLSMGCSFGDTDLHQKVEDAQKSQHTIRVETKICHFAYLDPGSLLYIMTRHS